MLIGAPKSKQRVIAVITDSFAPFHQHVLEGIRPHFSAAGYGTLGVAGRDVRTDRILEATDDHVRHYQGAFGTQLDVRGAVVVSGATQPGMSEEALASYVAELTDGPVVSLGVRLPNLPSVEIDWPVGIAELMEHMLDLPGAERLAFVRGFPGDPHSEMREAGFRAALLARGRTVDEDLFVNGNFSVADARNAVAALLDSGRRIDGLIAANDDMAIGAMAALNGRGFSVPNDVFVAGFDNALCSVTSNPPLTTVLLNTAELTAASAGLVLEGIESGETLSPDTVVQIGCNLIVRESTNWLVGLPPSDTFLEQVVERWEPSWAPTGVDVEKLAEYVDDALQTGDRRFLDEFGRLARAAASSSNRVDVIWIRHAWRELHAVIAELSESPPGLLSLLGQLAAIDRVLQPTEARHQTEQAAHRELQERLVMRIATCPDPAALWRTLRSGLQSLGMRNAWVVTHEGLRSGEHDPENHAMRLVFSLEGEDLSSIGSFDARQVLPDHLVGLLAHDMHVLVPLRAGDSDIGYLVLEPRGDQLLELEAIALGIAQVLRHVRQVADLEAQTERLHMANEALDRLARQDTLTGLANRKLFLERLESLVEETNHDVTPSSEDGDQRSIATVFLDLDGFKQINDTLGHAAGDQLLRILAGRLSEEIEPSDTLARLGGDEFTIIVVDANGTDRVHDVARRVLTAAAEPALVGGCKVSVSASLGIALFPGDGTSAAELMRNADIAMYAAKEAGKNRVEVYCDLDDIDERQLLDVASPLTN